MTVIEGFWKSLLGRLPCVICSRFGLSGDKASLHHVAEGSGIRSTFAMVPLCYAHHQGPGGLHGTVGGGGPKTFIRLYRPPGDSEFGLLVWAMEDMAGMLRGWLITMKINVR